MAKSNTANRASVNPAQPASPARPATAAAAPATPAKGSASVSEVKPSADQIRRRAYEIYQERTARGIRGDAATDWIQAEREISRPR